MSARPADWPDVEECSHGEATIAVRPPDANHEGGEPEPAREQAKNAGQKTEDEAHEREHLSRIWTRRYQLQVVFPAGEAEIADRRPLIRASPSGIEFETLSTGDCRLFRFSAAR